MEIKMVYIDNLYIASICRCVAVFFMTTSCVGQGINRNDKIWNNEQAAELQRKETAKPEISGTQCKGFGSREILIKFKDGAGKEVIKGS